MSKRTGGTLGETRCKRLVTDIYRTEKKYSIIYADPPWFYNKRNNPKSRFGKGASGHYDVMKYGEIAKLPIKEIAAENCALFMWVTFPTIEEGISLFNDWGFKYKTLGFSWVKTNPRNGKPFFGTGYYAKSNCEVCLMGIKGRMTPISNSVSSCIISPRREHSKKPDEVRERITKLFGDLPRIELFARELANGWDSWGNEV